ncbi:MAG: hypothetical protein HY244_04105 [Rhizobiales bacterium]|nr:hypothetical protein [Hyphomicrobiales bacterium]
MMKILDLVLALWLSAGSAYAQGPAPFQKLAGHWSGNGTIELANGAQEPIRCRAAYDVLEQQSNLQLNIRCASQSYSFDLRASATYAAGTITGSWSESTRNAAGTISGKADGDRFQVVAKGPAFTAILTLVTRGNRQSVTIQSQDEQTRVKGASIALQRGS